MTGNPVEDNLLVFSLQLPDVGEDLSGEVDVVLWSTSLENVNRCLGVRVYDDGGVGRVPQRVCCCLTDGCQLSLQATTPVRQPPKVLFIPKNEGRSTSACGGFC